HDGAYLKNLTTGTTAALLSGAGDYDQVALDRAASQVAFVSNHDDFAKDRTKFTLYYATAKEGIAHAVVASSVLGAMRIAETGNVTFTRAGNAIVFGAALPRQDTLVADSLFGKAVFDLWHYKD